MRCSARGAASRTSTRPPVVVGSVGAISARARGSLIAALPGFGAAADVASARPAAAASTGPKPVDVARAGDLASYRMTNYTLFYSSAYGSDEIQSAPNPITGVQVAADGLSVRLKVDGLRELYIHELHADGLRSAAGE